MAKRPGSSRSELSSLTYCYLVMRRGKLREAMQLAEDLAGTLVDSRFHHYAEVYRATCASLLGEPEEVDLERVDESGNEGLSACYCIIAARRGEFERAFSVRFRIPLLAKILFGRIRFAHARRTIALIQTTLRGQDARVSADQRAGMIAAYPGEFDYFADRWPEVAGVIERLDLYATGPTAPARAAIRPKDPS